jgi:AcrR family transcriptional regulator
MKTSARSNSRQTYHRGNVREDLIAVGKEILESEDLHALTLRRLTREIGVNPTNFYNHFANMDYLFAAIKVEGFSELLKRSRKATEDQSSKPAALRALFREYIFFAIKNPNLYRLMFDYYLDFDDHQELKEITDQTMADVVELLYATDVFDSSDPLGFYKSHPMAVTCWSTMHGLTHILIGRQIKLKTKSRKEVGEFADSIVDVLLDGVLERVRRNTRSRKKAR